VVGRGILLLKRRVPAASRQTVAFSNAGHNQPLLIDQKGMGRYIEQSGLPLGMFRVTRYYEYFLQLEAGQTLLLYTDGVTEAESAGGEEYGRDRLAQITRRGSRLSARELIDDIYADILRHTEGRHPTDDVTFLIIKALNARAEQ
jgi:sigma-B regulation protein RsbU (phosphoserine phosphatase)